ncbi:hypothetical protein F2Q68_00043135 [Brassica cretica]|uniref:Uncharacterized protein n=2 Tax=Brassica cretica TaxID=69181 RepID=A0A3N6RIU3_BRACR|nr:hypothetical protein F2Q68_00043135 [Brassica cretica]KAF3519221.1 hypothetical protein DY000_02058656 [Brassica cretica]
MHIPLGRAQKSLNCGPPFQWLTCSIIETPQHHLRIIVPSCSRMLIFQSLFLLARECLQRLIIDTTPALHGMDPDGSIIRLQKRHRDPHAAVFLAPHHLRSSTHHVFRYSCHLAFFLLSPLPTYWYGFECCFQL